MVSEPIAYQVASVSSPELSTHSVNDNEHEGTAKVPLLVFSSTTSLLVQLVNTSNQLVMVRLDDNNLLVWKQQILISIRGYDPENFIPWNYPSPPKFINGTHKLSPNFISYQCPDQLLTS